MTYTDLVQQKFMSEIMKFERVTLGNTEHNFLKFIGVFERQSAYDMFLFLKNLPIKEQEGLRIKPMAYKNVHERFKRLLALGLISEIKGNFKRNAKMYRITSRGLFQLFITTDNDPNVFTLFLKPEYRNNIIMKTLLFQFFEMKTIKTITKIEEPLEFAIARTYIISEYLRRCCERIVNEVESSRFDLITGQEKYIVYLWQEIEFIIDSEIRNLISLILSYSVKEEIDPLIPIRTKSTSFSILSNYLNEEIRELTTYENGASFIPISILTSDRKFMNLLKEIKKEFDIAYNKFISK